MSGCARAIKSYREERAKHEEHTNNAEDNCRVGEKQDFDKDKNNAEHKKSNDFPARQASQIVAKEEKRETKCSNNPR